MEVGGDLSAAPRVMASGRSVEHAAGAVILIHGRGGTAADILALGAELGNPDLALLAPEAEGRTWYPERFLAPREANEPWLSRGLAAVGDLVEGLDDQGISPQRVLLLGFSQGACLALELAARRGLPLGGVAGLTGGLIGAPGELTGYEGDMAGTPVLLGSGDPDAHVPWSRVESSAAVFRELGARVRLERYPGLPHTINAQEIAIVRGLVDDMLAP